VKPTLSRRRASAERMPDLRARYWWPALMAAALGSWPVLAFAQVPLRALGPFFEARPTRGLVMRGGIFDARTSPAWKAAKRRAVRRVPVGSHHEVIRLAEGSLATWITEGSTATWSPPRHLLLDRARETMGTPPPVGGGSGQGVVIGIIDGGVDVAHPDLRNADGSTRVAWWIDFSSSPAGLHPELEAAFGCEPEQGLRCRILAAADIDERLQNGLVGDEPRDPSGHGTHIASIAAGNGLAGAGSFVGIAPEATLIVARVTGTLGTIADSDVVLATEFVFDRALELGWPAVANLSLGGDFGAHDGSSELSQVLASFIGEDAPGRAIVVAGGNSGEVQRGLSTRFPEPLGIHTEVEIRPGRSARAPLLVPFPSHGGELTDASLFVWLNLYPAAALTVTLELPDGTRSSAIGPGQVETLRSGELVAAIIHGMGEVGSATLAQQLPDLASTDVLPKAGAAVILVDGRWPSGEGFTIEVAGEGRAELWVQSEGDLAPETGSLGAVFPAATPRQTVTIPATHPELIAVGASINRVGWTDHTGAEVNVGALRVPALVAGGAAFFSSAGPNALGDVKPDVVAPGAFVIASMGAAADPRRAATGIFASGVCAGPSCQVVSDSYAVTAGTSMAAPMVSGAVALLFQRDPTLTQNRLRRLLQAGSTPLAFAADVAGREGGGVLSISRSMDALSEPTRGEGERPDAGQSRLRAAGDLTVPDPGRSIAVLLWLRDAEGAVFDAALARVRATASGGQISQALARVGPGLYELRVAALAGAESLSVEVFVDEQLFLTHRLPVDSPGEGRSTDGGCTFAARPAAGHLACLQSLVWLTLLCSRRRTVSRRPLVKSRSSPP
jgi:subtilisin family serine protease